MEILKRRSRRVVLTAEVKLRRSEDAAYTVQLRDLSEHGCSIELINKVQVGERLWIKLPGLSSMEGLVCWEREFTAGVDFVTPLHPAVLQTLSQKLKP